MQKYFYSLLTFLTLVSLLFTNCKNEPITELPDPNFHIYLCFGQSNMEGTGTIEPQDTLKDDRFLLLQPLDCPDLNRQKDQWYPASPPLSNCYAGLSPADHFGKSMVNEISENIKIGVINVAVGGCDIRLFDKDIYMDYDSTYAEDWFADKIINYGGNPYQFLINQAKVAQKDGVIQGILLHQGETNTGDEKWPIYVNKIYNHLLDDLTLEASEVPLFAGEVVAVDTSCCAAMNPIINTLPEFIPTAHVVSAQGLTAQDKAHFDSEGYRILGKRYADKVLEVKQYQVSK